MQMLATISEEFGEHEGLGLDPGTRSCPFPTRARRRRTRSRTSAGVALPAGASWTGTPLAGNTPGTYVYLVHSFHVVPRQSSSLLAICRYGGHDVTAAIRSGRITGCQFHPEKSGEAGLAVLRSFLAQ